MSEDWLRLIPTDPTYVPPTEAVERARVALASFVPRVWPVGFARFVLEARDPEVDTFSAAAVQELERILGTRLRTIRAHS